MVGHIILKRELLEWEYYQHPTVFRVFIHLMMKANFKPKKWMGTTIQRGQLATSLKSLSGDLRLSEQQIRTALNKLVEGGHITKVATNSYSLITILNYDSYQSAKLQDNMPVNTPKTNEQHSINIPITTTKESNKEKTKKSNSLEVRKQKFIDEVYSNSNYDRSDLKNFIGYWTELNGTKSKMRFEKEEFFELEKRITKWISNKNKFNNTAGDKQEPGFSTNR